MEQREAQLAIGTLVEHLWLAWLARNPEVLASMFAESATLVSPDGCCHIGQTDIQRAFRKMLDAGSGVTYATTSVRTDFPRRCMAVAIIDGTASAPWLKRQHHWSGTWGAAKSPGGEWQFVTVHTGALMPRAKRWYDHVFGVDFPGL